MNPIHPNARWLFFSSLAFKILPPVLIFPAILILWALNLSIPQAVILLAAVYVLAVLILWEIARNITNSWRWGVGEDAVRIEEGLGAKKRILVITLNEIEHIDLEASFLHRRLDIVDMVIHTTEEHSRAHSEVLIPALPKVAAENTKEEIIERVRRFKAHIK